MNANSKILDAAVAASNEPDQFDVLVAGSGAGGMVAALVCHDLGLRVLLVEKANVVGGTTAFSGGGIWAPLSRQAVSQGVQDSEAEVVDYLTAVAGQYGDAAVIANYAAYSAKALAYLEDNTHARFTLAQNVPDYYQKCPGAKTNGRSLETAPFDGRTLGRHIRFLRPPLATLTVLNGMMISHRDLSKYLAYYRSLSAFLTVSGFAIRHIWDLLTRSRSMRLTNGNALSAALFKSLLDRGVEIRTGHGLTGIARQPDGSFQATIGDHGNKVHLAKGVILACGGFPWDRDRQRDIFPHVACGITHKSLAPETNTGDGIRIGESNNGVFSADIAEPAAWVSASRAPLPGGPVGFPHYKELMKAGFILVNAAGERFTNESKSYQEVTPAVISETISSGIGEVYLICDHRALRREGLGVIPPGPIPLSAYRRNGYLTSAATIGALANQLGIPENTLVTTVEEFNQFADTGVDQKFGRGGDAYQRAHGTAGHLPNPCLGALRRGPFHAIRLHPSDMGTFAGLKTGSSGELLDTFGNPVPGLYAVGNDMISPFGGAYPGGGATLGPAITFGYLAAHALASKLP